MTFTLSKEFYFYIYKK